MKAERAQKTEGRNGAQRLPWVFLSFFCLSASAIDLWANDRLNGLGIAFVDSLGHKPQYRFGTENTSRPLKLHQSLSFIEPCELRTGLKDHVFLKFSNHVSLGMMENTSLAIENFRQASFKEWTTDSLREPSKSSLKAQLKEGKILIKTDKFSPLSTFQIKFPMGTLEFHAAECVIEYRYNILKIALYRGNISLTPQTEQAEPLYLSAPSYFTSDRHDLKQGIIGPSLPLEKAPKQWANYLDFIQIVNGRIQFFPLPEGSETVAEAKILIEKVASTPNASQ